MKSFNTSFNQYFKVKQVSTVIHSKNLSLSTLREFKKNRNKFRENKILCTIK